MANITTLRKDGATHESRYDLSVPYVVDNVIDFAEALEAKGSALAALDTIEALIVPAGTMVLKAGLQTIAVDDATTLTLDLGFTGGDVDEFVDGYDQAAAVAGAYSAYLATDPVHIQPITTADTIDLLLATLTGTLTVGKVRVFAIMCNVAPAKVNPGLVALGT